MVGQSGKPQARPTSQRMDRMQAVVVEWRCNEWMGVEEGVSERGARATVEEGGVGRCGVDTLGGVEVGELIRRRHWLVSGGLVS